MTMSSRHRSVAFLALVVLSLASLAASQHDGGSSSWAASDDSSASRSNNGVAMTSFVKHGGGAGRKASSDGDDIEGGDASSTAKTIAQRIDEALEQEFPEEKKKDSVGKTYTEKAKQEDVSLMVTAGKLGRRIERWEPQHQHPFFFKQNSPFFSFPPNHENQPGNGRDRRQGLGKVKGRR